MAEDTDFGKKLDILQQIIDASIIAKIEHPIAIRATIVGEIIKPGTRLLPTDVYASTTGKWEYCPCPGALLPEGLDVIWVRPLHAS